MFNKDDIIYLGIDLDETLISNNPKNRQGFYTWKIKKNIPSYLRLLYINKFRFNLITARCASQIDEVEKIVRIIEKESKVRFESITCTGGRPKCIFAEELDCKYMIDDYDYYLSDYNKYNVIPILLEEDVKIYSESFNNWKEIVNYLLDKN